MIAKRILFMCILTSVVTATVNAEQRQTVELIAVEYPPYTSEHVEGYGSVVQLVSKYAEQNFSVDILPRFYPPARAQKLIAEGDWCLSLYPPQKTNLGARFIPLSDETVALTLFRLKQSTPFKWEKLSELKGKSVAMLRSGTPSSTFSQLTDAGLTVVYVESVEQGLRLILKSRVDFAFGDEQALLGIQLGEKNRAKLQLAETSLQEARVGVFYNINCEAKLLAPR